MPTKIDGTVKSCSEGSGNARSVTVTFANPSPPPETIDVVYGTEELPITQRIFDRFEAAMLGGGKVDVSTDSGGVITTLTVHKP